MDDLANVVEIHDDAGWSLSLCFGRGLDAGKRMREFSDAYRASELVPASALAEAQAEISRLCEHLLAMVGVCDGGGEPGFRVIYPPTERVLSMARAALGEHHERVLNRLIK